MSPARLITLALAATTLAASGCGGSSKTVSTDASTSAATAITDTAPTTPSKPIVATGKPMTRAELISVAGEVCKRINSRHTSLKLSTQQSIIREIPLFAAYQRASLDELSKLIPPASMKHDWKQFTAAAHTLAIDTTAFGEYAQTNHVEAAFKQILPKIGKDEHHVGALARHDSIVECERVY